MNEVIYVRVGSDIISDCMDCHETTDACGRIQIDGQSLETTDACDRIQINGQSLETTATNEIKTEHLHKSCYTLTTYIFPF